MYASGHNHVRDLSLFCSSTTRLSSSACACAWYAMPRANASEGETLWMMRLPFVLVAIGSSATGASERPMLLTIGVACRAASADD